MSDINEKLKRYLLDEKEDSNTKKDKKNKDKFVDDGKGLIVTKFKEVKGSNK